MNRNFTLLVQCIVVSLLLVSLNSCVKDNCKKVLRVYSPQYQTLTQVRAGMKSGAPRAIERPGKLYLSNDFIFLNEIGKGIHVIDNSDPKSPKKISFITVPGNLDLAMIGNTLYADSYAELVAFDIRTPQDIIAKKFVENVFPDRSNFLKKMSGNTTNPDSILVVASWTERDSVVDCNDNHYLLEASADKNGNYGSPGIGGSMARFTILKDYLYTVTTSNLHAFNIDSPLEPTLKGSQEVGWDIETIFPYRNNLFIGSSSGMFIYDASTPEAPKQLGTLQHVRSCDPVIAEENLAFVTLRSGTTCNSFTNQLEVVDIRNLMQPTRIRTYDMTNPHGLSKDGPLLFICDGRNGLKIYNAADILNLKLIKHVTGIETYDVIAHGGLAIVVAQDGLYQFDYQTQNDIQLVSKIPVESR